MIGATAPEKAGHVQNPPSLRYEVTPCISMGDFSSAVSPYIYSLWCESVVGVYFAIGYGVTVTRFVLINTRTVLMTGPSYVTGEVITILL